MAQKVNCPNQSKNKDNCPCVEDYCPRHGICCECILYHKDYGDQPACLR